MFNARFTCLLLCALVSGCSGSDSNSTKAPKTEPASQFLITASSNVGGSILPERVNAEPASAAEFTINLDEGYIIESVTGCEGLLDGLLYQVNNVATDCDIDVLFARIKLTVTASSVGEGSIGIYQPEVDYGDALVMPLNIPLDQKVAAINGCDGQLQQDRILLSNLTESCHLEVTFESLYPAPESGDEVIRLPVVVHVLGNQYFDISDAQIITQIIESNKHFRAKNINELKELNPIYAQYAADAAIQFYLADKDPEGEPTSGIVRVNATVNGFGDGRAYTARGGSDAWDTGRYINVWIGFFRSRFGDVGMLGRAYIPGMSPERELGMVIEQSAFGVIAPREAYYHLGKTMSHEMGHFLGLLGHLDAGTQNPSDHRFHTCDGLPMTTCTNAQLPNNFMDTRLQDKQMKMFSLSQAQIMREWLIEGPLKQLYHNAHVL